MIAASKYRDMSVEELQAALVDIGRELFLLRNEMKVSKKREKPHRLRERRRDRARILTVLTEKQTMNNQTGR